MVGELVADEPVKWKLSPAELARFWVGLAAVLYSLAALSYFTALKYRANEQTGL